LLARTRRVLRGQGRSLEMPARCRDGRAHVQPLSGYAE
jgi:hypothetical protein